MALENPLWMQGQPYSARLDRQLIASIFTEGVISGLVVSQRAAGVNMTVDIAPGRAVIQGDDQVLQGSYLVQNTTVWNLGGFPAAPPAGQERVSLIFMRINDPNAGGPAGSNVAFGIVNGTAAATGTATAPAVPSSAIPLASVLMTSSTASIVNSMITSMIVGASSLLGDPVGTIIDYAGPADTLDQRYLPADGRAISRTYYSNYFQLVGTTFGVGNGSTTFNIPDLRGRVVVGLDGGAGRITGGTAHALGGTGGTQMKTLSIFNLPAHAHSVPAHDHGGVSGSTSITHTHSMTHTHPMPHTHTGTAASAGTHDHSHYVNGSTTYVTGPEPGANIAVYTAQVGSTGDAGAHTHTVTTSTQSTQNTSGSSSSTTGSGGPAHTHSIPGQTLTTNSSGSSTAFDALPPWMSLVKAIKVL